MNPAMIQDARRLTVTTAMIAVITTKHAIVVNKPLDRLASPG